MFLCQKKITVSKKNFKLVLLNSKLTETFYQVTPPTKTNKNPALSIHIYTGIQ